MIKILSVKTRRENSTRDAFRRHYEERHVPLGLGSIERFRWRKYARNHVVAVHSGRVDFDCLTEFWVASRADQESTRAFTLEPGFRVLDEDDARFLDIGRRFSCELEESVLVGTRAPVDPPGTRRLTAIFARPAASDPAEFARALEAEVRGGAWGEALASGVGAAPVARVALDVRVSDGPRPLDFAALVSVWSAPGAALARFDWKGEHPPVAVVELEVVETPASALFAPA